MKTESEVYVSENDEQGSLNKILNGDISERSENLKVAAEGSPLPSLNLHHLNQYLHFLCYISSMLLG